MNEKALAYIINKVSEKSAWVGHEKFALWLVDRMKPQIIVDVGMAQGYSTFMLALPGEGKVFGIDRFDGHGQGAEKDARRHYARLWKLGLRNVEILKGDSSEIARTWQHGRIDVLHIDADHTYEGVKRDYEAWSHHVRKNGVILFHDVVSPHPGVGKFFFSLPHQKLVFQHAYGLGVLPKSEKMAKAIMNCGRFAA